MYWTSLRSSRVLVPVNESHHRPKKSWTCDADLSLILLNWTPQTFSAQSWNFAMRDVVPLAVAPVAARSSTYTVIGIVKVSAARAILRTTSTKKILNTPGMPRVPKSPLR